MRTELIEQNDRQVFQGKINSFLEFLHREDCYMVDIKYQVFTNLAQSKPPGDISFTVSFSALIIYDLKPEKKKKDSNDGLD